MKLMEKDFAVNQTGSAKIVPEEADDLWLLYNIIAPGDYVTADTTRKVHLESTKSTATRVRLSLHLKVTSRDFQKDSATLRVQGRNLDANQHVAAGSFHTLTLEANKPFVLSKKLWKDDAVEALREGVAENGGADAELAVVLFRELYAEIYLLGKGVTSMVSKIKFEPNNNSLSRAGRKGSSGANNAYFREVFGAFVKRVDLNKVKRVVIVSEASTKDQFRRFIMTEAKRTGMRSFDEKNGMKIAVAALGCKGELSEVLGGSAVMSLMKDSRVGLEIRALKDLWDMISSNSGRACYGPKNVESAVEMNAIETLLITDELYRSEEVKTRKKYAGLVKSVKEAGGKALVYSSLHVMAEQLAQLTGVAAILRFPLPDLEDMDA